MTGSSANSRPWFTSTAGYKLLAGSVAESVKKFLSPQRKQGDDPTLAGASGSQEILLKPGRVFDGVSPEPHEGWVVLIRGERIVAAGPADEVKAPADARV